MLEILNSIGMPETAYILSAGICATSGLRTLQRRRSRRLLESAFWIGLALILVTLAIFKLENVQVTVANEGRELARSGGWYRERREILEQAIKGVVVVSGIVVVAVILLLGELRARLGLTVLSAGGLLCFIAVRTLSLHQVDSVLYRRYVSGAQVNVILESGLVLLVGAAALLALWVADHKPPDSRLLRG